MQRNRPNDNWTLDGVFEALEFVKPKSEILKILDSLEEHGSVNLQLTKRPPEDLIGTTIETDDFWFDVYEDYVEAYPRLTP